MFELEHGHIRLSRTESKLSFLTNKHFRYWGPPSTQAEFRVGPAAAAVLQPDDELSFHREETGDLALTVIRNESLVLAIGAVTRLPTGGEIKVEEDPRLEEARFWELSEALDQIEDPGAQVIWIDPGAGNLDNQLEQINRAPGFDHVFVGIRSVLSEKGEQIVPLDIWEQIPSRSNGGNSSYYTVDVRFGDKNAWLDYVRQLPKERPKDLYLSFTTKDKRINLCEGQEAEVGMYYVAVQRICRMDFEPGELSMLAIARLTDSLTKEMVLESAKLIMKER